MTKLLTDFDLFCTIIEEFVIDKKSRIFKSYYEFKKYWGVF